MKADPKRNPQLVATRMVEVFPVLPALAIVAISGGKVHLWLGHQ